MDGEWSPLIFGQTRVTNCKCGEVRKGSNWAWNWRGDWKRAILCRRMDLLSNSKMKPLDGLACSARYKEINEKRHRNVQSSTKTQFMWCFKLKSVHFSPPSHLGPLTPSWWSTELSKHRPLASELKCGPHHSETKLYWTFPQTLHQFIISSHSENTEP